MAKPIGSVCNLNCDYCYYLEKEKLYPKDPQKWMMNDKILENFIAQNIYLNTLPVVQFTLHGGETLMRGIDFYQKVIRLQNKHKGTKQIENVLQTNGTMLNDGWCRFFRENNLLLAHQRSPFS